MKAAKLFEIRKRQVWEAYQLVKANRGSAGIDQVTIKEFEKDLPRNLYKIWNRMSSGSYTPSPVKLVEIPKADGKMRPLGIPTIADRVAQMVVVQILGASIDPHFHENSYGYRPGKSAHQALEVAKEQCRKHRWVIDLDVSKFFDTIDHGLMMKALIRHTNTKWILLYVQRWLTCPYELKDGSQIARNQGVPQGSVIGPLLSNLFLHYVFDQWMRKTYPEIPFERYADDIVCHCPTQVSSAKVLSVIDHRFSTCGLSINKDKTKIVYCKDSNRNERWGDIQFDFLGHTFRPRAVKSKIGEYFTGFNPAMSNNAKKKICEKINSWDVNQWVGWALTLEDIADKINPIIRGWINYYGKFYPSLLRKHLRHVDLRLALWARTKFKRLKRHKRKSIHWLGVIAKSNPNLFAHWQWGYKPSAGVTYPAGDRVRRAG